MAQTFSYSRLSLKGDGQPTLAASSVNPSGKLLAELTGPASSVSSGMTILSIGADFGSHIYGGKILGSYSVTTLSTYDLQIMPSSTYTAAACKIVVRRVSTWAHLSSGVSLSTQSWIVELTGY